MRVGRHRAMALPLRCKTYLAKGSLGDYRIHGGVLTTVAIASQATITEIPDPNTLAISMIAQTLIVTAIVFWIDRNRVNSVK